MPVLSGPFCGVRGLGSVKFLAVSMFFKDAHMRKKFSSGRDFHRAAGIALILGSLAFSGPPSALAENPAQVSRTLEQAIEMDQRTQKNEEFVTMGRVARLPDR